MPTQAALSFVGKLEDLFSAQIGPDAHLVGVSHKLLELAQKIPEGPFYSGDFHKLFLQMFES